MQELNHGNLEDYVYDPVANIEETQVKTIDMPSFNDGEDVKASDLNTLVNGILLVNMKLDMLSMALKEKGILE